MSEPAFVQIGEKLREFLLAQFSPPPGASTELAFLGTGVPVSPASFRNGDVVNPLRVNTWLNVVADQVAPVVADQLMPMMLSANQLMQLISAAGAATAGSDTPAWGAFNAVKAVARQAVGTGGNDLVAVPLDWYDDGQIPQWSTCSVTVGTPPTGGGGLPPIEVPPVHVPPVDVPPLWRWRRQPELGLATRLQAMDADARVASLDVGSLRPDVHELVATRIARPELVESQLVVSPQVQARLAQAQLTEVTQPVRAGLLARVGAASPALLRERVQVDLVRRGPVLSEDPGPVQQQPVDDAEDVRVVRARFDREVVDLSSQIATATDSSTATTPVQAPYLSASLSYRIVQLARPWWSEPLLLTGGWYIPGMGPGSLCPGAFGAGSVVGVPVALVLTSGVRIQGAFTDDDRAALAGSTHVGPWELAGGIQANADGTAEITAPAMQAIACIVRLLPALPPAGDPALFPPSGGTTSGGPVATPSRTYTVANGDSLWSISAAQLGDGRRWPDLYAANKSAVGADPNRLTVGTVLTLP